MNKTTKIKKFLEGIQPFYDNCESIAHKISCKSHNYIGINYHRNNLYYKFYYTFFDKIPMNLLGEYPILSDLTEFRDFIDFYNKDIINKLSWQNTGLTFSIKQTSQGSLRTGFHLRGKEFSHSALYIPPKQIRLTENDLNNYQGIYFEYENNKTIRKNYYYITDLETKTLLANIFNNNQLINADVIEYTESELGNKVILWYNPFKKKIRPDIHSEIDNWLFNDIGLQEGFFGFYQTEEVKAKYYNSNNEESQAHINSFDTYKYLINKLKL